MFSEENWFVVVDTTKSYKPSLLCDIPLVRGDCVIISLVRGDCVIIPLVRGNCGCCISIPLSEEVIVGVVALSLIPLV